MFHGGNAHLEAVSILKNLQEYLTIPTRFQDGNAQLDSYRNTEESVGIQSNP